MPRAAMKPTRLSSWSMAAERSSLASSASARSCATDSSGSPAIARKRLMIASASRGSAPPFSVDCSRKRSAISATVPPPTDRVEIERVDQRREQRDVAGADFDILQSEGGGGLERQRQHFRIRRGAVLPAKGFDAGLQELARPAAAIAKHRPEIAEARGLPGAPGGEIIAGNRNGEIGTQA